MKKTSTIATASNKNLPGKLTVGLDLGDRSSWYCVLEKGGGVVGEQKVSPVPQVHVPRLDVNLGTARRIPHVSPKEGRTWGTRSLSRARNHRHPGNDADPSQSISITVASSVK